MLASSLVGFRKFAQMGLTVLGLSSALASSKPAHALQKLAVTVGPDFPHIITGEVDLLYTPRWNIGVNAGGFAYNFQGYPVSVGAASVRLRWHPFQGSFFFGLAGGMQKLSGSGSKDIVVSSSGVDVTVPTTAAADLLSPYVMPYMGWFVVTRWGFTFGLELGYQVNFGSSSGLSIGSSDATASALLPVVESTSSYQDLRSNVQDKLNQIGNLNLPYASVRIGWTF